MQEVGARLLKPESILGQGSSSFSYKTENADWSGAFRNWKQWSVVECKKWILINASKDSAAVKEWVSSLQKVAPSLGMKLSGPKQTEIPGNSRTPGSRPGRSQSSKRDPDRSR